MGSGADRDCEDIAALQGSRIPIEGAPGLGYVLRRGFDLPPLMFTSEEADAIAIGMRLLRRLRDANFQRAAESVLAKLAVVVPEPLQTHLVAAPIYVSDDDAPPVTRVDPAVLRLWSAQCQPQRSKHIAIRPRRCIRRYRSHPFRSMATLIMLVGLVCLVHLNS